MQANKDLDRTLPAAEIEDVARELEATRELAMQANKDSTSAKRKWRWDVTEPMDKNVDPNHPSLGEWSKEALDAAAPKNRRSHWEATPADVVLGKTPKRSQWDQTQASASPDAPMVTIIMNAPGFMHEDKHNRYLTDEELDAVLLATGYAIVTPPPGYAPMVAPRRLMATPIAEPGKFHLFHSSSVSAAQKSHGRLSTQASASSSKLPS